MILVEPEKPAETLAHRWFVQGVFDDDVGLLQRKQITGLQPVTADPDVV